MQIEKCVTVIWYLFKSYVLWTPVIAFFVKSDFTAHTKFTSQRWRAKVIAQKMSKVHLGSNVAFCMVAETNPVVEREVESKKKNPKADDAPLAHVGMVSPLALVFHKNINVILTLFIIFNPDT